VNDQSSAQSRGNDAELELPVGRREAVRRVNRAMDYIDSRLAERITLKQIAAQAHFSIYHFARVFTAITGETPGQHLRRVRLQRAASLLYAWPKAPILDVALATGFQSAPVFARAFRLQFGMSASDWRRRDFWHPCGQFYCWRRPPCGACDAHRAWQPDAAASAPVVPLAQTPQPPGLRDIKVERLSERRLVYMRMIGPFGRDSMGLWRRFIRWLIVRNLRGLDVVLFAQLLDSPYVAAPEHYRHDAGVLVDDDFVPDRYVNTRVLPGGWFVTARFTGRIIDEARATDYLRVVWLPENGYLASGARHYVCMPRRSNASVTEPRVDNVLTSIYYLPILPPGHNGRSVAPGRRAESVTASAAPRR
jgi:AraC family transcriptional regulator